MNPRQEFLDWFANWIDSMYAELRDEFTSRYPTLDTAVVMDNLLEAVVDTVNRAYDHRSQFWGEISDRFFSARGLE